jgi:CRISPR-associated protein Cmr5
VSALAERQGIELRRAAKALEAIKNLRMEAERAGGLQKEAGDYVSYVSGFPATILTNGLGQAAASLLAQSKGKRSAHRILYDHLSDWLCGGDPQAPYPAGDLLERMVEHDQRRYLRAQAEALAYLDWLKRLAVALLAGSREGRAA